MQLFTTFGVQSSVPPKTVVAVIGGSAGGTNTIPLTFVQSSTFNADLTYNSSTRFNRTNWVVLNDIGNPESISINNAQYLSHIVTYPNFTVHQNLQTGTREFTFPAGTTHFAFQSRYNNNDPLHNSPISWTDFQTLTVSYEDPATETVTFFDEYPNGTQIGNAVEFTAPVDYNVTFVDNSVWTQDQGIPYAISEWTRTEKMEIINNSINISNELYTRIFFWDNSTFIGYYGPPTDVKQLGTNPYDFTIPNNATHFAIDAIKVSNANFTPYDVISATQFKTITISTAVATVDPPATYKIRQLVFE